MTHSKPEAGRTCRLGRGGEAEGEKVSCSQSDPQGHPPPSSGQHPKSKQSTENGQERGDQRRATGLEERGGLLARDLQFPLSPPHPPPFKE